MRTDLHLLKSITLSILMVLSGNLALAESASMTLQALDSMAQAERDKVAMCEQIRVQPTCVTARRNQFQLIRSEMNSCRVNYLSHNCDAYLEERPELKKFKATCGAYDVCRQSTTAALMQGCSEWGIELSRSLNEGCSRGYTRGICIAGNAIESVWDGFKAIASTRLYRIPGQTLAAFNDVTQRYACLDTRAQQKITCQLLVSTGLAVVGTGAAAAKYATLVKEVRAIETAAAGGRALASVNRTQQVLRRSVQSGKLKVVRINREAAGGVSATPIGPESIVPGRYYAVVELPQNQGFALAEYDSLHGGHTALARSMGVPVLRKLDREGATGGGVIFGENGEVSVSGKMLRYPDQQNANTLASYFKKLGFRIKLKTAEGIRETNKPAVARSSGKIHEMRTGP